MEEKSLDIDGSAPIPWSRVETHLEQREFRGGAGTYWLSTTCSDGSPHTAGVLGVWLDGQLYFASGSSARKTRNLTANPACAVSASLPDVDLVLEGTAIRVTDAATLQRVAEEFGRRGWPATVSDDCLTAPFGAPSARPPWYLYAVTPVVAFGVATKAPAGASRWRFPPVER